MVQRSMACAALGIPFIVFSLVGCDSEPKAKSKSKSGPTQTVEPHSSTQDGMSMSRPSNAPLKMIVLGDKRCKSRRCRTARTIGKIKRLAPKLQVERLDWSSPRAQKIFTQEGLKFLPAYLFSASDSRSPKLRRLARYLKPTPKGAMRRLKARVDFDPRAEICDNSKDDTGNGLVDCKDPTCDKAPICRKEIPKRLDVFVMSQCPYGTKALDSMSDVLKAFDYKISFHIHYIASKRGSGFRSLHGQAEVDENIRQLCAMKHFPKRYKYMDYIYCRNRKIRSKNWKKCTGKRTGIDTAIIEKCATGPEGKQLFAADIELAKTLRIGSSPTWLANNRFVFHGIPPESIKVGLCKRNPGLKGCELKLSTKSPVPDGVCN